MMSKCSIALFVFQITALSCAAVRAGDGASAAASSTEMRSHMHQGIELDESNYPRFAIDGVLGTKWVSEPGDDQWVQVDMGRQIDVEKLFITWDHNYPADFDVLLSKDGKAWKTVYIREDKIHFDNEDIQLEMPEPARHIKLLLRKQRENKGFGFFEITVNNEYIPDLTTDPVQKDAPYRDTGRSAQERAENLLTLMTYNEKLNMCGGVKRFYITALKRFGIPEVLKSDASCGMNAMHKVDGVDTHPYTSFPATLALAATWNPELGTAYGKALGQECRSRGVGILLGPGVNIQRISQCGRNFEYMGEDPFLAGIIASAYVRGMQSQGVISTVKHLIANNQEFLRSLNDVQMSERTLREIYLPAFKAAAVDAEAGAVMTAYNSFGGSPCGSSKYLMNDLMRGDLGFKGMFMTDWSGYGPPEELLTSGQNIMMPSNAMLVEHIRRKAVTPEARTAYEKKLDAMLLPLLQTLFKHGLYDRVQRDPDFDRFFPAHKEVARKVGEEGITLLKNDGILPLSESSRTILLLGDRDLVAGDQGSSGNGSGFVGGYDHARYLSSIEKEFGKDRVLYREEPTDDEIRSADVVLYFLCKMGCEAYTTRFEEPVEEHARIRRVAKLNSKIVVIYNTANGDSLPWLDESAALLYCYFLGQERGHALASVLSGRVNPSGKLPFTMEKTFSDSPARDYNLVSGRRYFDSHPDIPDMKYPAVNEYSEGVYIGYRWYDAKGLDVRFPFGFGLSYTTFEFSDLSASATDTGLDAGITLRFKLKNTGERAGAEVAQVYVEDVECGVDRPPRELKAFEKVFLTPGETAEVELQLTGQDLAFWSEENKAWSVEPGTFRLHIGSSSRNTPLTAEFSIP